MRTRNLIITALLAITFSLISVSANASMYSRRQARNTIEQTSYIINQAYEIANYYSYWQTNKVSRAMYYNNYAQDLYFYRSYRSAIRYSLLAREYALDVIDNCDDYWEFFYYTYFGWSHRYGYNYSFAYRSGYMDGYYDGYYARYCARHSHDYRKDPYHNMHNDWYNEHRYNEVVESANRNRNTSSVALGRGETGLIGSSSSNGSGTSIGRTNYTNVASDNYFSQTELAMLKDIPSENTMEIDFKRKNPTVSFSDENLSKNTEVINRNSTNASAFSARSGNKETITRTTVTKPTNITLQNGNVITGRSSELKDVKLNPSDEFNSELLNRQTNTNTTINRSVTTPSNNNTQIRQTTPTRTVNSSSGTSTKTTNTTSTIKRNTTNSTNNSSVQSGTKSTSRTINNTRTNSTTRTSTTNKSLQTDTKTRSVQSVRTTQSTNKSTTPSRSVTTPSQSTSSQNNNTATRRISR